VSGTLAYALGAGRVIVSTPSTYATELLGDGRGVLVPPHDPAALSSAVITLLDDPARRGEIGRKAWEYSRGMVWSEVANDYRALFARVAGISVPAGTDQRVPARA
jgi:glycosyltransferase involved in cell wall biosynthesis